MDKTVFTKALSLLFFLFVSFLSASYSQSPDVKKLDSLFDVLQTRHLATGSVAISINGKPVNTNYFMNIINGTFFEFDPNKGKLQIKETDNVYYLRKE